MCYWLTSQLMINWHCLQCTEFKLWTTSSINQGSNKQGYTWIQPIQNGELPQHNICAIFFDIYFSLQLLILCMWLNITPKYVSLYLQYHIARWFFFKLDLNIGFADLYSNLQYNWPPHYVVSSSKIRMKLEILNFRYRQKKGFLLLSVASKILQFV